MGMFKPNFIWYLLIIGVLALILTPIGLAFFGVAILSTAIIAVLIGYFLPVIFLGLGVLFLMGIIPVPGFQYRILGALACFFAVWALWNGVI